MVVVGEVEDVSRRKTPEERLWDGFCELFPLSTRRLSLGRAAMESGMGPMWRLPRGEGFQGLLTHRGNQGWGQRGVFYKEGVEEGEISMDGEIVLERLAKLMIRLMTLSVWEL